MTSGASVAWAAAVLCGGASRRMGRDKALLVVDGEPMVRRVVASARAAGAATVLTIGGDRTALLTALAGLDARIVADRYPGDGPLGGLVTALGVLDEPIVLLLACDLLWPNASAMATTVGALAAQPGGQGASTDTQPALADVAVPEVEGREQWLHAAWRKSAVAERLEDRFAAGERSVHRAVAQSRLVVIGLAELDPAALADADTPEDLHRST